MFEFYRVRYYAAAFQNVLANGAANPLLADIVSDGMLLRFRIRWLWMEDGKVGGAG